MEKRYVPIRDLPPDLVAEVHEKIGLHSITKVQYFQDTDTPYIEFRSAGIVETKDLDEDTQLDVDVEGILCAITIEHARERADLQHFSFGQVGT